MPLGNTRSLSMAFTTVLLPLLVLESICDLKKKKKLWIATRHNAYIWNFFNENKSFETHSSFAVYFTAIQPCEKMSFRHAASNNCTVNRRHPNVVEHRAYACINSSPIEFCFSLIRSLELSFTTCFYSSTWMTQENKVNPAACESKSKTVGRTSRTLDSTSLAITRFHL